MTAVDVARYVARLESERFTGRVQITLEFNRGGISRRVALKQDSDLDEQGGIHGHERKP